MLRSERASAGNDGVGRGCTTLSGCSTAIECDATGRKSPRQDRSNKPRREANGEAQCEKSARCVRRGGAGNVARSRWCDTRRRKSEPTGNTNFDLNRRASPRPYLRAPGGAIPPGDSPDRSVVTEHVGALALKGLTQPAVAYNVPLAATQQALRVIEGGPPSV